ncbi:MAG TPA: pantoate--beta-alanine ligase [Polyangiaceae bacterium]|jgi:pantoate--beta-alanine ligase
MPPRVVSSPSEFRAVCDDARRQSGKPFGFVPTMGALHEGHLALVREAKKHAPVVGVSIFVNPTQFGPHEDFSRYPRDLAADVAKLASVGADVVFAPEAGAMYPQGEQTRVRVGTLADSLCGPFRPGHFEGVATVVAKLFALVGPSVAVFGKKDYQQLAILRRLATDLFFPVTIVGHPIVRESDGLAMSSRNAYLSAPDRQRALALSRGLRAAWQAFGAGERRGGALRGLVRAEVEKGADSIDYVDVTDADSLAPFVGDSPVGSRALVAIACRVGATRLIDNVVLGEDPIPGG